MTSPSGTDRDLPDLDSVVTAVLDDPEGGAAVGTFGAIAEFVRPAGAAASVRRTGAIHEAVTDGGALRVDTGLDGLVTRAWRRPTGAGTSWSHAIALCLPADRAAGPGRDRVTELGPDADPVLAGGADEVLVDLGLGVDHLEACVRTADPALLARLRDGEGRPLDGELSAALVAAGPVRVFRTVAARVEVATPIPPPIASSPAGPHTHLLPDLLARRRTHAATDPIPAGHVAVAMLFPAHPQHDALGRPHPFDEAADAAFGRALDAFGEPDELAAARHVRDALARGAPAETPPTSLTRAGRRGWETELRRAEARGDTSSTRRAWRRAVRPDPDAPSPDVPFHEAHG